MKLSELNPVLDLDDDGQGGYLTLDCPHCKGPGHICIKIARGPKPDATRVWGWNGETDFEKLTIEPSINYANHWHGYVQGGQIVNA